MFRNDSSCVNPFLMTDERFYSALEDRAAYVKAGNDWLRNTCE